MARADLWPTTGGLWQRNWLIGGACGGAAARLDVKRTTLIDKMRRHGLSREVAYGELGFGIYAPRRKCL